MICVLCGGGVMVEVMGVNIVWMCVVIFVYVVVFVVVLGFLYVYL